MRIAPTLLAAAFMATASCASFGPTPTRPLVMPPTFDVEVANITTDEGARAFCTSAAAAHDANWPGLYWTQRPGGPSTCVLTRRAPGAVQPIIYSSNCAISAGPAECLAIQLRAVPSENGEGGYESREREWYTSNEAPVALRERPEETAPAIGQIAPRTTLVILDFLGVTYFSHRGVFRAPYAPERIEVGQVVVPTFSARTTPWIDGPRYDPRIMGSDTMTYPQRGAIRPPPDGAPALDIAWEDLPLPSNPRQMWALVRLPDGSIGWADFEALAIELGLEDE